MTKVCAAAVQAGSRMFDLGSTIEIFRSKLDEAKNTGADMSCFPKPSSAAIPRESISQRESE